MRRRVHHQNAAPRQKIKKLFHRHKIIFHRRSRPFPPILPADLIRHPRPKPVDVFPRDLTRVVHSAVFQETNQRAHADVPALHRVGRKPFRLQPPKESVLRLDQVHCGPPSGASLSGAACARSLGWQRFSSLFKSLTSTRKYTCVDSKLLWPKSL